MHTKLGATTERCFLLVPLILLLAPSCAAVASLAIGFEAEYPNGGSVSNGWGMYYDNIDMGCGRSIYPNTGNNVQQSYISFNVPAVTGAAHTAQNYYVYILTAVSGGFKLNYAFDSTSSWSTWQQGGWDIGWFTWVQIAQVSLFPDAAHTLNLRNWKGNGNYWMFIDQIVVRSDATPPSGILYPGQSIPPSNYNAAQCNIFYFEAEFSNAPGLTAGLGDGVQQVVPDQSASDGASIGCPSTSPVSEWCNHCVYYTINNFNTIVDNNVYYLLAYRALAPSDMHNGITIRSNTESGCQGVDLPVGSTYQWFVTSHWYKPNDGALQLCVGEDGVLVDQFALLPGGQGNPVTTVNVVNFPSYPQSCTNFNGLCDFSTTCKSQGVCSSCGWLRTGDPLRKLPNSTGCYLPGGSPKGYFFNDAFHYTQATTIATATFPTTTYSVDFWVRMDLPLVLQNTYTIFTYLTTISPPSNELVVQFSPAPATGLQVRVNNVISSTKAQLIQGRWHHIAIVKGAKNAIVYLDGTNVTQIPVTKGQPSGGTMQIGFPVQSGTTIRCDIDELTIWNGAANISTIQNRVLNKPENYTGDCGTKNGTVLRYYPFTPDDSGLLQSVSRCTNFPFYYSSYDAQFSALLNLYYSTNGPSWNCQPNCLWSTDNLPVCSGDVSTWFGIDCEGGNVVSINLAFNNLNGVFPESQGKMFFAGLPALTYLFLHNNSITGSIPSTISLTPLAYLYMWNNKLNGAIPSTFWTMNTLVFVYLYGNSLSGSFPTSLAPMTSLQRLHLYGNQISGSLPTAFPRLLEFNVSSNLLSGTLPSSLINANIPLIDVSHNQLTGPIPDRASTSNSTLVQKMDLSYNQLGCFLPPFMRNNNLTFVVDVTGNLFTCPLSFLSPNVRGAQCKTVVLISAIPSVVTVPAKNYLIAIKASNTSKACSSVFQIKTMNHYYPVFSVNDTYITFKITTNDTGYATLQLFSLDNNPLSNQAPITFKANCNCVKPFNCTSPISGICQCNASRTGPDCSWKACVGGCVHGHCNYTSGKCICDSGFQGTYCTQSYRTCPKNCNSPHGICNTYTGTCICQPGYWGYDCTNKTCPPYNQPYCNAPHGICNGLTGNCTCILPYVDPSTGCVKLQQLCKSNCRAPTYGYCNLVTGKCVCYKVNGIQWGGENCTEVICNPPCGSHGTCLMNNTCKCNSGYTGATCAAINIPCTQCNATYGVCNTTIGHCICKAGYGGANCTRKTCYGNPECNKPHGYCVATQTTATCICYVNRTADGAPIDWWEGVACTIHRFACPLNCTYRGTCDTTTGKCLCGYKYQGLGCEFVRCPHDCSNHGTCDTDTGVCDCEDDYSLVSDCSVYTKPCPGNCSNVGGGYCYQGVCKCYSGYQNDPNDTAKVPPTFCTFKRCPGSPMCTQHGTCNGKTGECICDPYWVGIACTIPNHTCPNACSGNKGRCNLLTGICTCVGMSTGDDCSLYNCPRDCTEHGVCNKTIGICMCNHSWTGADCSYNPCADLGYCHNPKGFCNSALGVCVCNGLHFGVSCNYTNCTVKCLNGGTCNYNTGQCDCINSYSGTACEKVPCKPLNCYGHGQCNHTSGKCMCKPPWLAPNCSQTTCPQNCSGHGKCNTWFGNCTCNYPYNGPLDPYCARKYVPCTLASDSSVTDCGYSNNPQRGKCDTSQGKCSCFTGYSHPEEGCGTGVCIPACINGACNGDPDPAYRKCDCDSGWTGDTCNIPDRQCGVTCVHGSCNLYTGVCSCTPPYVLPDCSTIPCPYDCHTPHGTCDTTTGRCTCDTAHGYYGTYCQYQNLACNSTCNDPHGYCNTLTGNCVCDYGWINYDCSQKLCPGNCNGHGKCNMTDGTCDCDQYYSGVACEMPNLPCPLNCSGYYHGFCDKRFGICHCKSRWYGNGCQYFPCPNNCTGHGSCDVNNGTCTCAIQYRPPDCRLMYCPSNCTGHGTCIQWSGECQCSDGFTGDDCSEHTCPQDCSGKGDCDTSTGDCKCTVGYTGSGCDKQNWWIIVVAAGGGSLLIVAASVGTFLGIRQYHIHRLRQMRRRRMQAFSEASGGSEMPPLAN